MPKPRLLTTAETAAFLLRHPTTAARVAITRTGIAAGVYDINFYDTEAEWGTITVRFPGVIEPRGIQVSDSEFGLVTIQPTLNGIYFSGWSPTMGDANKGPYIALPFAQNPLTDLLHLAVMAGAGLALVYLGGKALEGRAR